MNLAAKITLAGSTVVIAGLVALAVPAFAGSPAEPVQHVAVVQAPTPTPTPYAGTFDPLRTDDASDAPLTELPEWAQTGTLWLIYPDGFKCSGTEGCPNDYRVFFGEPGDVLPDGVEYYDPAKHDYNPATNTGMVFPADQ